MATETIAVLEAVVDGSAVLVGWSDGGIVSLLVSLRRPDLVARQVLIGTNYHHDGLLELDFETGSDLEAMIFRADAERSPTGPSTSRPSWASPGPCSRRSRRSPLTSCGR